MPDTRVPDDWEMERDRQRGLFVCQCPTPRPVLLPMWADYECGRCGRKVIKWNEEAP